MRRSLVDAIWKRADHACEYCRLPQVYSVLTFEIDHVLARKHGGATVSENLALSCFYCNSHKGSNLAGLDPLTGRLTQLFHPRRHAWKRHFSWQGAVVVGRTPIGRATIIVLRINSSDAIDARQSLIDEGVFPLD